ncbi:MAG: DNA-3-methyladenine glycosylase I [Bacteroidales bacterium]|nr:DNA-3-methyladenine glycosylase I [Bacteroidales bacterium]
MYISENCEKYYYIYYAFIQAAGLVNDHTTDCFRYSEV